MTTQPDAQGSVEELLRQLADVREQQAAVAKILRLITEHPGDIRPVFAGIAEQAVRFCGAEDCLVGLVDGTELRVVAGFGGIRKTMTSTTWPERPNEATFPIDNDLVIGAAILERCTLQVEDTLTTESYPTTRQVAARLGFRSVLAVPILLGDEVRGGLMFRRSSPGRFDHHQIELAESFAAHAAIALENVRLFNETKEALEQQTATAEVLRIINRAALDLPAVLTTLVGAAGRLSGADVGWLNQVDDHVGDVPGETPDPARWTGGWSRVGAFYGQTADLERQVHSAFGRVKPIGGLFPMYRQTATSLAIIDRKIVNVADWTNEPELRASGFARAMNVRALLAVPLLRDGDAIGAIGLARLTPRAFSDREVALVQTFADQAVIAIENVRLLNEIQEKSAQLAAASQHKSEFLANMSHELRTPLNAIIGFSDVLLTGMAGDPTDRAREYLEDIRGSGQHLLSLINDVLDLSKVEAGRMELDLAAVSIGAVVEDALALVRERAAAHGIALAVDVPSDLPQIAADGRKLRQALLNLLSNAVKFTPDGGWIGVRVARADDEIEIAVSDSGVGIAPEDQARIFEEFRQARRPEARAAEGTGLGLTLTKRFVELHGGRIALSSEVGKGSTFTIRLPVRQPAVVA